MSLREAIDAKCKDCIYDEQTRLNWKKQVTLCTCTDCPLYEHRPISGSKAESFIKLLNDASIELPAKPIPGGGSD